MTKRRNYAIITFVAAVAFAGPAWTVTGQQSQPASALATPTASAGCPPIAASVKLEAGCYTTTEASLGTLPTGSLFWHVYTYPTRAAAEAVRGPMGTVVESFGKHWLYTIAPEGWRPGTGERIAVIGPLLVASDKPYTAHYLGGQYSRPATRLAEPVIVIQALKLGMS